MKFLRQMMKITAICLLGFLAQCSKEEPPAPKVEETKPSLVDQYKSTSKETAENPGVAGAPGQAKEEEKKGH
jgi:hypothetical protein